MLNIYSTINTKREGAFILARDEDEARELAVSFRIVRKEKSMILNEHKMDAHSNLGELLEGNIVGWIALEGGRWGFKPKAHRVIGKLGAREYLHIHSRVVPFKLTAKQKAEGKMGIL